MYFLLILCSFLIASVRCAVTVTGAETLQDPVLYKCSSGGQIAITFDDGPSKFTEEVLDVLKEKGVKATFFVNGNNQSPIVERSSTLKRICAEGHEIGSHTWNHANLTNQSADDIRKEMISLEEKVEEMIGIKMTVMRPPYGNVNETVVSIVHGELNYSIIQWNLDTRDWDPNYDLDKSLDMYRNEMENASSQASSFISLHHDFVENSAALARLAIEYSVDQGYNPVTVSECLGLTKHKTCSGGCRISHAQIFYIIILVSVLTFFWNF